METTSSTKLFTAARQGIENAFGGAGHLELYRHPDDGSPADRFWQTHVRLRPDVFVARVLAGMDAYVDWAMPKAAKVEIEPLTEQDAAPKLTLLIQVAQPGGKRDDAKTFHQLTVHRSFIATLQGLVVHEDWTDCDGVKQPIGGARQLYRNLLPIYDELGVRKLTLVAKGMGGYVWATYGFTPISDLEWRREADTVTAGLRNMAFDLARTARERTTGWLNVHDGAITGAAAQARPGLDAALLGWQEVPRQTTEVDERPRDDLAERFLEALGEEAAAKLATRFDLDQERMYAFVEHLMVPSGLRTQLHAAVIQPVLDEAADIRWRLRTWQAGQLPPNGVMPSAQEIDELLAILDRPHAAEMLNLAALARRGPGASTLVKNVLQLLGTAWKGELVLTTPRTAGRQAMEARIGI